MAQLEGKVALVTGGSRGIGADIALSLAAAGASVAINFVRHRGEAERVAREIESAGGRAAVVQGDIGNVDDAGRIVDEAAAAFGRLDILVNNAGVYFSGMLSEVTVERFRNIFDINVLGTLIVTQTAARHMAEHGGSIINIGSMAADGTDPGIALYSATKGAIRTLTTALAVELAPKIRVNGIAPGLVDTDGSRAFGIFDTPWEKTLIGQTPLQRAGLPSDYGPVAVFLASEASGWITGEMLRVAGGRR